MRIAILAQTFPPTWIGGTEIATRNIATFLARTGHEVHVVTSSSRGLPKECTDDGFVVHRVRTIKTVVLFGLSYNLACVAAIREIDPDIVFCQYVSCGLAGYLAKKFSAKPYVVCGQGSDVYLSWAFKGVISKLALRNADAVVALTRHMRTEMQELYPRDVSVIPIGIELNRFSGLSKDSIRARLGIDDERVVVSVARLEPIKGMKYLISAINAAIEEDDRIRLFIIGDGSSREDLERLTNSLDLCRYITFVGTIPNEKVPDYMAAADIFVLPSLSEGFPVTLLEAMASGLPIVTTRVGGLPDIIKDGENGFLVEPENPQQIADKLQLLLHDEELRNKISSINKETVKRYSWENVTKNLEQVFLSIRQR